MWIRYTFFRTDNGKVIWYYIDFPEVIELRKRFMEENSRHFFIGNSILSPEWISKVKTGGVEKFEKKIQENVNKYLEFN